MSKDARETVSSFFSSSQLTTSSKLCQENLSFQSNFYTKVSKQIFELVLFPKYQIYILSVHLLHMHQLI